MKSEAALNKLCKWRSVLVGWMIGSKSKEEPGVMGYRDLVDRTLILRAEVDALINLMMAKEVFDLQEWDEQLAKSAEAYDRMYEQKFRGYKTFEHGVSIDTPVAMETNKLLRFPD